jgi:hypothetical protein
MARKPAPTAGRAPASSARADRAAPAVRRDASGNASADTEARPEFSDTASRRPVVDDSKANDGGAGPPSSLKTKTASGGDGGGKETDSLRYSVQVHTDEKGLEVFEPIDAKSGDEAAQKALAKKNYKGASVRGVTPYSDPDPNSLGGERDAGIMIGNAQSGGDAGIYPLGTEANAKAVEELGKADIEELGE